MRAARRATDMELTLRYYGDPILRRRAEDVTDFDAGLREFAQAMIETMQLEAGVGLAAPQVGVEKRVLIALQMSSPDDEDAAPIVMVNPEVTGRSKGTWVMEEGCLSIPGIRGDVTRAERVQVRYQDLDGVEHVVDAEGMYGRVLQHEIDHLDGRLFIDYLSPGTKILLKPRLKKLAERGVG